MKTKLILALVILPLVGVLASSKELPVQPGNGEVIQFPGAFPKPPKPSPQIDSDFNHKEERFFVHVPASYTGKEPFGLIVFVDAEKSRNALPAEWEAVLEKRKILFVAPQNVGNDQSAKRRQGLAVASALAMMRHYNIDRKKVYSAGLSGGARIAGRLGFHAPDVFRGTIQSCGADFHKPVPLVAVTAEKAAAEAEPYGIIKVSQAQVDYARTRVKFVLITGSNDFRYPFIQDIYNGGYKPGRYKALLLDVPDMGHVICDGAALEAALDFLGKP